MTPDSIELRECDAFRVVDQVIVAGGTDKVAFRAFPTLANFGGGELLIGYYLGRDHHVTPPASFVLTRSMDGGRTWGESFPFGALPGYNVTGNLGLLKLPDESVLCKFARYYYPGWRRYRDVSLEKSHSGVAAGMPPFGRVGGWTLRRLETFIVRSWDRGYNWTPTNFDERFELFPGPYTNMHGSGDKGAYELSDGRWMTSVQGCVTDLRSVAGVTFSSDQGYSWSPVQVIHDYDYGSATEQRILKLGGTRWLSYTRVDPSNLGLEWDRENHLVHLSLSEDDGKTWGEPWKSNFMGSGAPEMLKLRNGALVCIYRDMDFSRAGMGVSCSSDEGRTWEYVGRLCGPSDKLWGWPCESGYPVATQLEEGTYFLAYYGPATADGNANVVGLFLEDKTN